MWFLEHESLFGGKRVWLRPGSQHLFGRTKHSDEDKSASKNVFIDNKNVSRKHMMIRVLDVPPENGTKLHARSHIEITDLSCRQGTVVDGSKMLKSSKEADGSLAYDTTTLTGSEHTIKLSNSYPPFAIKWHDIVFTYASKEKKDNTRVNARNAQLHAIDIKTSSEFVYGKTTHVVSQKRNLPKVLQALVSGTPVVTADYLDAILGAATRSSDADDNYTPSKLEEDFDTWWPQEKEHIPPAGAEPVPRPEQMLAPDPARAEVFSGLTFIFLNEAQHTSLHQVIAGGGGKALLFDIRAGETTVEEYVEYVKSVTGEKKRSRTTSSGLPVVTIRLPAYPDNLEDWAANFVTGVDRSLNQRSILQNEFLDAIISKDTSSLRRPPTEAMDVDSSMPATARTQPSLREPTPASQSRATSQVPEDSSAPVDEPVKTIPRKRPIRRGVTSRFTGFDDYEPPPKSRKIEDTPMEDVQESLPEPEPSSQAESAPATQTQRTTRSRIVPTVEVSEQMDQMFPAAAAIKKQRAATRPPAVSVEPEPQVNVKKPKENASQRIEKLQKERSKKVYQDINVKEETRKRIVQEEEKRRDDEETMRAELEGVDISELRVDIQIVEMPIRRGQARPTAQSQVQSEGWNPDWNRRKDFKKFRHCGAERGVQSQKVMVGLQEVPQRKGFGDSLYLEEDTPIRTTEDERRLKRRVGRQESDSEPEAGFRKKKRTKPTKPTAVINVEDSGPDEEEISGSSGSTHRNSGRTQRVVETQVEEQAQRGSKKRGAISVAAGQPSSKKSRVADRDDSDEETGFRFGRRG